MSLELFFALYCVEAGFVFLAAPWTRFWTLNPLLHHSVRAAILADSPWVRGLVSGIGIVHLIIGIRDIRRLSRPRSEGRG
jgi:hypothetical protein